jgi:hypothetical protein
MSDKGRRATLGPVGNRPPRLAQHSTRSTRPVQAGLADTVEGPSRTLPSFFGGTSDCASRYVMRRTDFRDEATPKISESGSPPVMPGLEPGIQAAPSTDQSRCGATVSDAREDAGHARGDGDARGDERACPAGGLLEVGHDERRRKPLDS